MPRALSSDSGAEIAAKSDIFPELRASANNYRHISGAGRELRVHCCSIRRVRPRILGKSFH